MQSVVVLKKKRVSALGSLFGRNAQQHDQQGMQPNETEKKGALVEAAQLRGCTLRSQRVSK